MSIDRCEYAFSAVKSLVADKSWLFAPAPAAGSVQMAVEADGVTTITVLLDPNTTGSDADQYADELCSQLGEMGHTCTIDRSFRGLRTVTQLVLRICTGDDRGGL